MLLSFKEHFISKILIGSKIHTIRLDHSDRWGSGAMIHFCTDIRKKSFKKHLEKKCISTQKIEIIWLTEFDKEPKIFIDNKLLDRNKWHSFVKNDGFDTIEEFLNFQSWDKKNFKGKIIHWTDLRY
jgi:hypothetical protein